MPDQITVAEFVAETNEDYKSPTASNFTTRMTHCRNTVAALEEVRQVYLTCSHGVVESSLFGVASRSVRRPLESAISPPWVT